VEIPVGTSHCSSFLALHQTHKSTTARAACGLLSGLLFFALSPAWAQTYTYEELYEFSGNQGENPSCTLVRDSHGNLYGTTVNGGAFGYGTVFKLGPAGKETVLYSFTGGADGGGGLYYGPPATLVRDSAGNLYGMTYQGGTANLGVVFKVSKTGHETVLHSFLGGADGLHPAGANLLLDSQGDLYGTTGGGGTWDQGVIFKLDPAGNETILYSFTGGKDGGQVYTGVIQDEEGNLYGTTTYGGANGVGVVYKLSTAGKLRVLHAFAGGVNGGCFAAADGCLPTAGLVRDKSGNLYGTTEFGGLWNYGTIFKITPRGVLTTVYSFSNILDGNEPS